MIQLGGDPVGHQGELVDRLIAAVNAPDDDDWRELLFYVVATIGGSELAKVLPDDGHEPPPGSYGADLRKTHPLVSRDTYVELVRVRLLRLVTSGLREDFLVRGLRDEITTRCQHLADTEEGDTRREELRGDLRSMSRDPEKIAAFRSAIARRDPAASQLTDDEIAARIRSLQQVIGPIQRASAQEHWDRVTRWNEKAITISDQAISVWFDKYLRRMSSRE